MADVNIRRDENLLCGRLVALPTTTAQTLAAAQQATAAARAERGFENVISIDFPAMPDQIEIARSAEYLVNYNIVMPDGIHQYKGTRPLEIPLTFRLHSYDQQYCKKGALTLLQLAARLHSFVLPISTFSQGATAVPVLAPKVQPDSGKPSDGVQQAQASQNNVFKVQGNGGKNVGSIFNPVTCWLHLMWVGETQPGISAIGYVKEVKVVFNGPWLRGPNRSFNLPSSADFSFVFVHRPGHGNAQAFTSTEDANTLLSSGQVYADAMRDRLYNTRDLVDAASYQGFGNNPSNITEEGVAAQQAAAAQVPIIPPIFTGF